MRRYIEETGLPFHILIDEDRSVTKAYGVWHKVGLDAWNISRPALFVVSKEGVVRAVWVAEKQTEFPSNEEILDAISRRD